MPFLPLNIEEELRYFPASAYFYLVILLSPRICGKVTGATNSLCREIEFDFVYGFSKGQQINILWKLYAANTK